MMPLAVVDRKCSRIEESNGQSSKARPDLLLICLLLGVALILMAFLENVGVEIIGGIVGGGVVLSAPYLWSRFRTFQLRYLSPQEEITAEYMHEYTAVRTNTKVSRFRIRLRPRIGLEIERYNFSFFDRGKLPWLVGRRRSTDEIRIRTVRRHSSNDGQFHDAGLRVLKDGGSSIEHALALSGGSCTFYELEAEVSEALKSWEGILSFRIEYRRHGNLDKRNVRTKFLVAPNDKASTPLCSLGKKILNATPIPQVPHMEGSQT
jgi:hypothetical protein